MRLSDSEFSLTVGSQRTITATVEPDVADYDGIVWASSDPKVASVVDGTVRGVRDGVTQITATASGVTSLPCSVTVRSIRVSSVSINKTSAELTVGQAIKLEASINPQNATNQTIFWSSSDVFVATVSNAGLVVSQNPGTATITLRSDDGDHTATCRVTVKAKVVNVTGVSLSKTSMTLTEGESDQLEATISPSNATDKTVNWTSSNTSVATVASDGTVTAKGVGSATITVTTSDGGKTSTCSVTVEAIPVSSIAISQANLSLTERETAMLSATVSPANATNKDVVWSSSNSAVASVNSDGTVTAKSAGTATITAKTADGGKTATCSVTVKASAVSVTGVSLNASALTLQVGKSATLTATVAPSDATDKSVTWISSNTSIATVSSTGVVTAKKEGSAVVTVKTADGGMTAKCSVTVTTQTVPVSFISLSPEYMLTEAGKQYVVRAVIYPTNATNQAVKWSSSDNSVATVDSDGIVTAISGGEVTITCTTVDGGKRATCLVSVASATVSVTGVSLDKTSMSLLVGNTGTLNATVSPSNATNKSVTWSSSNTSVATVSSSGVVTAKATGTTTVTVRTSDGGKTANCNVTVTTASVAVTGVSVTPTSLSLTAGDTYKLGATISPSNATNPNVSWSSSNTSVATVASDGTVTAKAAGSATITCTTADGGKKATCSVTVKAATISVTGVSLNQSSLSLTEGNTATLTATVSPSNATNKAVNWSSSNTSIATVSSSGIVTAKSAGSATITCTTQDGSKKATCVVNVQAATNVAVDLGMVVDGKKILWASFNLGATKEYEYGDYYAWGETETKSVYSWSTYKYCKGSFSSLTKYNTSNAYGSVDNKTVLEEADDVAHVKLGGNWRMPTEAEWSWIRNNCRLEWTSDYEGTGVSGLIVTGKNGNKIFLPATGIKSGNSLSNVGSWGNYWCSTLGGGGSYAAESVDFSQGALSRSGYDRYKGLSVRPVLEY